TVAGPSGAGKSSLVRAGVIPALKRSGQRWQAIIMRPGRRPLDALARILAELVPLSASSGWPAASDGGAEADDPSAVLARLRDQPGALGAALRARCRQDQSRILLLVDQFEELYTLDVASAERTAFLACLEGVADDESSPLRAVLSLRSDFLDRAAEDRAFGSEITRGLILLPPLGRDELDRALRRPLDAVGHTFESDDLVATMLDALQATRSPLPLLQFTAARLWDLRDRDNRQITRASYDQLGGVAGALASHADTVLASMTSDRRRLARAVFERLVTPERTRAIVTVAELAELAPTDADQDAARAVVEQLAEVRLLAIENSGDDSAEASATVELIHESLITDWPTLRRWLDENHEDAEFLARVRTASQQWQRDGRSEDLLWRGQAAEDARRWLARHEARGESARPMGDSRTAQLSATERHYIRSVVELAARARRRRRRVVATSFVILTAVAIVVSFLAIDANRKAATIAVQKTEVEAQRNESERQAQKARDEAARARSESLRARNASRMAAAREQQDDPTLTLALIRELESAPQLPSRWTELARWAMHQGVAHVVFS
ncbi:MAG: protein kinase, partial [Myxococcota bacterium]